MTETKARELCTYECKCGGKVTLAETDSGEALSLHTMPECEWFRAATQDDHLDALERDPQAFAEFTSKMFS